MKLWEDLFNNPLGDWSDARQRQRADRRYDRQRLRPLALLLTPTSLSLQKTRRLLTSLTRAAEAVRDDHRILHRRALQATASRSDLTIEDLYTLFRLNARARSHQEYTSWEKTALVLVHHPAADEELVIDATNAAWWDDEFLDQLPLWSHVPAAVALLRADHITPATQGSGRMMLYDVVRLKKAAESRPSMWFGVARSLQQHWSQDFDSLLATADGICTPVAV